MHNFHLDVSGNKEFRLDCSHQWYLVLKMTQSPLYRTQGSRKGRQLGHMVLELCGVTQKYKIFS